MFYHDHRLQLNGLRTSMSLAPVTLAFEVVSDLICIPIGNFKRKSTKCDSFKDCDLASFMLYFVTSLALCTPQLMHSLVYFCVVVSNPLHTGLND